MAIFSEGTQLSSEIAVTVFLAGCCLFSTCLNPPVFLYNAKSPHSIQRVVYRALATMDFLVCLLVPSLVSYNALKPTDCMGFTSETRKLVLGNMSILKCATNATLLEKMYTGVMWPCVVLPNILTAVLTSARLYHIK